MGVAEIEGCAGVVLFGESKEADLAAFKWAYKHLPVSEKYKLRIIHVKELENANRPQRLDLRHEHDDLVIEFKASFPEDEIGKIQTDIRKIKKYICGVTYEGENFEAALQHAVNSLQKDEGLDTLVLGWSERPPVTINRLESEKCSIVLAKVDSGTKLTFSMPPATQTSFGPFALAVAVVAACFLAYLISVCKSFFASTASHAATPPEATTKTHSFAQRFLWFAQLFVWFALAAGCLCYCLAAGSVPLASTGSPNTTTVQSLGAAREKTKIR